jgi:hypothetical protein
MDAPRRVAVAATDKDGPTVWRVADALWAQLEPICAAARSARSRAGPAAGVRYQVDRARTVQRVGRDGRGGTGVGGAPARVRRGVGAGLGLAGGRRVHRQGALRGKGGAGEAEAAGANPTDRGKPGPKRHLLTEGKGIPVAVVVTGAHRPGTSRSCRGS